MKFTCEKEIVKAEGYQTFEVEADSESESLELFKQGKGELVLTECEIVALGEYDLETIQESDPL